MSKHNYRGRTVRSGTIEVAPTTEVDKFPEGQVLFLDYVHISRALITDESTVGDFTHDRDKLRTLGIAVGYFVGSNTLVWKICRDLELG